MISPLEFTAFVSAFVACGFAMGWIARGFEASEMRRSRDFWNGLCDTYYMSAQKMRREVTAALTDLKEARAQIAKLETALDKLMPARGENGRFVKKPAKGNRK